MPTTTAPIAAKGGTLPVDGDRFLPVIGSGEGGTLQFDLWAKQATRLRMSLRVDPQGYMNPQMLQLQISAPHAASSSYTQSFSGKSVVHFAIPLREGASTARLSLVNSDLEVRILNIQLATP